MDLRQLRYFKILAAHQHFGRAAAVLHIAQPALSRQIQLLESELGVQLVERHSRGASLTREGELLLDRATFLLRYVEQIRVDILDVSGKPRGPVALGLPPALASVLVPPLMRVLTERYPEVRLRVIENFSPALSAALEQGAIDVAVLSGPVSATPLIHAELLLTERLCVIGLASDSRLPRDSISVSELRGMPLILTSLQSSGIRLALERATSKVDVELNVVVEVESVGVATQLIEDGVGWTVHFAAPIRAEIERGALRAVPIRGVSLDRYLAHSVVRPPSSATVSLMTLLTGTAQSLILDNRWPMAKMASVASDSV
ncbi:LysR family transcriptional regulator [Paraburkholderia caribensis]|nr:LysR family transcriptional regulator [Paraburkholderia caribensis]